MYKARWAIILLFVAFVLAGCGKGEKGEAQAEAKTQQQGSYENRSPEEIYSMMLQQANLLIIDVRTPQEFTGPLGHIPGAQLKPLQQIEQWAPELDSLKNSPKKIVLVCRSGNRSRVAAEYLAKRGFRNLINVVGGMRAWNEQGLPVEEQ